MRSIIATAASIVAITAAAQASGAYNEAQAALAKGDTAGAIRLFQAAAQAGDSAAAYNLGRIYSLGQGAPADPKAAVMWFRKAADGGNPGAQFSLGVAYQDGLGVRRDMSEAAKWFQKAADQDYADAEARLGALYAKGQGVQQDDGEAGKWYRAAAGHGDARAALGLAVIDAEGPRPPSSDQVGASQTAFKSSMNQVFGPGHWRETGGYRTQARENQLRAEGALTVRQGEMSRHSIGTPDAPGAYDIVVAGLSPGQAAEKIKKSGVAYHRLFPEGSHGSQGAHLHVEPLLTQLRDAIWRRNVGGAPNGAPAPQVTSDSRSPTRVKAEALSLLKSAASRGDSCAQRALSRNGVDGEASARAYLTLQKSGSCG